MTPKMEIEVADKLSRNFNVEIPANAERDCLFRTTLLHLWGLWKYVVLEESRSVRTSTLTTRRYQIKGCVQVGILVAGDTACVQKGKGSPRVDGKSLDRFDQ